MAEQIANQTAATLIDDLRKIEVFSDVPQDDLAWLAQQFQEVRLEPGDVFLREGDPADSLVVILEGEIVMQRTDNPDLPVYRGGAGQVTGLLPYSRLTRYPGTGRAAARTRLALLHKSVFPEMLRRVPELGPRLVGLMSDRIRETTRVESQREKMAALGKLSAGLAHELNNPAAAAQRSAASLRQALETVRDASIRLTRYPLSPEQREMILTFERDAQQYVAPSVADPLAQSDREESVSAWLEEHNVPDAWKLAPTLADVGVDPPKLQNLAAGVGDRVVADALTRITSVLTIFKLIGEIETSTRRISDLVQAIKQYSYMDRAALQEVDVHQGLDNTLIILGHRLKGGGIKVVRDYDHNLPRVCAYGGELNQVWTNLLDNAIEAMQGKGELRVRTSRELDRVLVEIGDTGPGIPPEIQPHIFEPFFTTKGVGDGTGLGLDTVCRIVRNHEGEIRVISHPGDTRFQVYLPIAGPKTQPFPG